VPGWAVPGWAVPVPVSVLGYMQAVHPGTLLPCAARCAVFLQLRPRVGEYVVAGTTMAWVWRPSSEDPVPDPRVGRPAGKPIRSATGQLLRARAVAWPPGLRVRPAD